ncbi:hypothetical protein OX89_13215 [Diaphorobacter sp. J5-51]|nr:hypothetical protein OX89_13215 [Diaphorobacter sp. J5-51]
MALHDMLALNLALLGANRRVAHVPFAPIGLGGGAAPARMWDTSDMLGADADFLADQMFLLGVFFPPCLEIETGLLADATPAVPQNGVGTVMRHFLDMASTFNTNHGPLLYGHFVFLHVLFSEYFLERVQHCAQRLGWYCA